MLNEKTKEFMGEAHKLNQVIDNARQDDLERAEALLEDITKIRLTTQQEELLSYFWHPLRQEVIEEIDLISLEHLYLLKRKTKSFRGDDACKIYRSMHGRESELFEGFDFMKVPNKIKLSTKGVSYVMKKNPIHSQFTLAFFKFCENKFSSFCMIAGLIGSVIAIVGLL